MKTLLSLDPFEVMRQTGSTSPVTVNDITYKLPNQVDLGQLELEHFNCPNVFYYLNQTETMILVYQIAGNPISSVTLTDLSAPDFSSFVTALNAHFNASVPLFTVAESTVRPGTIVITNGYGVDAYFYLNGGVSASTRNVEKILGLPPQTNTFPAGATWNSGICMMAPTSLKIRVNDRTHPHIETGAEFTFEVPIDVNTGSWITYNKYTGFHNVGISNRQPMGLSYLRVRITDSDGYTYRTNSVIYKLIFSAITPN